MSSAPRTTVIVAPVHVNAVTVIREMARKGCRVVAVDSDPKSPCLSTRFISERVIVPHVEKHPGAFNSFLLSRRDLYGSIVIPTDDFYLREIIAAYDELKPHYRLAVPPPDAARTALDKSLTYAACDAAGIPVPRTRALRSLDGLPAAAEFVGFPAILRPAFSIAFYREFGVKSFLVSSAADAARLLPAPLASGHDMLLQQVIPGPDENVVSCRFYAADSGDVLGAVPGYKLAIYPPGFGVSQMQEARPNPHLVASSAKILRAIGFRSSLGSVEWKLDPAGSTWKLLEINARSMLAIGLMKFSGSDVLEMLYRDKLRLPQLPPPRIIAGARWAYLKNGLLLYRSHPERYSSLFDCLRMYRPPITFALFDPFDIKPFLRDIAPLFLRRFRQ